MLLARAEAAGVVLLAEATAAVDIGSAMGMGTPQPQLSPCLLLLTVGALAAQLSPLLLLLAGAKAAGPRGCPRWLQVGGTTVESRGEDNHGPFRKLCKEAALNYLYNHLKN